MMAESRPTLKPELQKPPGYRDPTAPPSAAPKPPPRRRPLPPSFRQPGKPAPRRHSSCCRCRRLCCWVALTALLAAALVAVAAGLAYLWFQPRLPSFRLQSLNATRLRVADQSDGTFLDAAAAVGILFVNPNRKIADQRRVQEQGGEARGESEDEDGAQGGRYSHREGADLGGVRPGELKARVERCGAPPLSLLHVVQMLENGDYCHRSAAAACRLAVRERDCSLQVRETATPPRLSHSEAPTTALGDLVGGLEP
ncbi:hypothetical protein ZIOFF_063985 [Zingiber officinale]|uniref:Uncharacterized protein n=1 Tax=Zingiber officinale TaxID=94328 RepID=A0A8J5F2L7_ZINOF|nr:hypothetical protein ZIOFF_063985 [Zingiber officinale]